MTLFYALTLVLQAHDALEYPETGRTATHLHRQGRQHTETGQGHAQV